MIKICYSCCQRKQQKRKSPTFLYSLSKRFERRGLSANEFLLTMTRAEISNYLGVTVETISRLLTGTPEERIDQSGRQIDLYS